jgi:AraC-like DNA-binding protein/mono/diheme cytochrome c family protein
MHLLRTLLLAAAVMPLSFLAQAQTLAQAPSPETMRKGAEVYKVRCAMCHDNPQGRIPTRTAITISRSSEYMLRVLTVGAMRQQAAGLKPDELNAVVAYLMGRLPGSAAEVDHNANRCRRAPAPLTLDGPSWNGWGSGLTNVRYQAEPGLTAADVGKLKLKWAFAYPAGASSQPTIVEGRVFVPTMAGIVFSLDAATGCTHWATDLVYRLLTSAQGSRMRHLAMFGGHAHRMVRAVEKLRENFNKPSRIEDIARELGMSVSGFHAHFRAVTAMSPLQFQKQLRLQEARRLMLSEDLDAAEAGYRVGYDDASHFSREYKRHFGEPPMRDVERLRELATA